MPFQNPSKAYSENMGGSVGLEHKYIQKTRIEPIIAQANHLVKRHNVYPAAEANVFGVEAEDALLLQPLLRERIIGCQRGRQDRRHDERQDVETVEQDFVHGSLKAEWQILDFRSMAITL